MENKQIENDKVLYKPIITDIKELVHAGRNAAYNAVNKATIMTYWNIGKKIVEEEQAGTERAEYGKRLISILSDELTKEFGSGFSDRNLRNFRKFYLLFPDEKIWNACVPNLNWTHFRSLLRVDNEDARIWYMKEAASEGWSSRTLDRNISTQYYFRLLQSPKKEAVITEMQEKTKDLEKNKYELIKSPVIAEFLGFKNEESFLESDLESAILSHIRDFLMELGKGFAFVARQQHIVTETDDYYIDLVFYNIELRCYVLIDLKMGKLTHQDLGQMQMYVNYYTREMMNEGDSQPIGIVLCADKGDSIVKYTLPEDNHQIFASKYFTYLPTEEELKHELNLDDFYKLEE